MSLEIVTIPCLKDNYAYLAHDGETGATLLVDAPDPAPIEATLASRGWRLDAILITHHHDDHIAGVERLRRLTGARVVGPGADAGRLPPLDEAVHDGSIVQVGPIAAMALSATGHTRGHVAYHVPAADSLFSADSLMVMGCGRLFEGSADEMWATLSRLAALPAATRVYSGHEYTESNVRFALSLIPDDPAVRARSAQVAEARAAGRPTMGATLAEERAANPFLRAGDAHFKETVGLRGFADADAFAELRRRKDAF